MKKKQLDLIFNKIPEEKQNEAKLIYDEMSFILTTLTKLKKIIRTSGAVEDFQNGKQQFLRESPALTSYNKMVKTFDICYKNLIALLPKDEVPLDDSFDDDDL